MSLTSRSTRHSIKRVGVISDTHGLVRDEALAALRGSDVIVHAGDIGSPEVLARLREIAPVHAVRGNNDRDEWARELPLTEELRAVLDPPGEPGWADLLARDVIPRLPGRWREDGRRRQLSWCARSARCFAYRL